MYLYICKKSISEFFNSSDKDTFVAECDLFIFRRIEKKSEAYSELYGWINFYNLFQNTPIHVAIVSDRHWYTRLAGSRFEKDFTCVKWKGMPRNTSEVTEDLVLAETERLWNDDEYWLEKCKQLISANLHEVEFSEVVLGEEK